MDGLWKQKQQDPRSQGGHDPVPTVVLYRISSVKSDGKVGMNE